MSLFVGETRTQLTSQVISDLKVLSIERAYGPDILQLGTHSEVTSGLEYRSRSTIKHDVASAGPVDDA